MNYSLGKAAAGAIGRGETLGTIIQMTPGHVHCPPSLLPRVVPFTLRRLLGYTNRPAHYFRWSAHET
jgi:hypothetical protein